MISKFKIDKKLEADSHFITVLALSEVRLINNSDYNWLILIPQKNDIMEITDLSIKEYNTLGSEIRLISKTMQKLFKPNKLNIASLGNVVKQLHVHIIARFESDKLFPKPVWGCDFTPYSTSELELKITQIKDAIEKSYN